MAKIKDLEGNAQMGKRRRQKNIATLCVLLSLVLMFYLLAMVRLHELNGQWHH